MNKTKIKIIGSLVVALIVVGSCAYYFSHYQTKIQTPIKVSVQSPIVISKRVAVINITNLVMAEGTSSPENVSPLTPDQQYGCNLFGKDCKTFLAIFRAESGLNPKAINVNTNGSVDFGCMQINSVHLKNIDTNKVNLLNCHDNIDVAFTIYKQQGNFSAWAAYNNGSYKKYLIN